MRHEINDSDCYAAGKQREFQSNLSIITTEAALLAFPHIFESSSMQTTDVLILGAGIAGASAAYYLAPHKRVMLLERESQPGYHATGRSAALYSETYGNAAVRAITTASKPFYFNPPEGFSPYPLVTPRGSLSVGGEDDRAVLEQALEEKRALIPNIEWWTQAQILQRVPVLKPEAAMYGVYEPDATDMDVHGIHQGFLRGAKAAGAQLVCDADVQKISRVGTQWQVDTSAGSFMADVVVNAAGAWCDEMAKLAGVAPVGLSPMRRTAFNCEVPAGSAIHDWPMVIDAQETFYMKPDAGMLLVSPANEDPVEPQDVQPEELDVAIAVDRLETATTLQIRRVQRSWAGLRSFVKDRTPVVGYAPDAPGFFWLAGQGGYGIQTAPAMGELSAALIQGLPVPAAMATLGVTEAALAPARLVD
jgi:D-arginine dehydrogenase